MLITQRNWSGVPATRKLEQLLIVCGPDRLSLKDKSRMVIITKENGHGLAHTGELFLAGPLTITKINRNRLIVPGLPNPPVRESFPEGE